MSWWPYDRAAGGTGLTGGQTPGRGSWQLGSRGRGSALLVWTRRGRRASAARSPGLRAEGARLINEVREADVRRWYAGMLDAGTGRPSAAKAYRVLRAMLNTALDDGMIKRNPCRIPGAGDDKSAERPVLTIDEVLRVVDAMPPRLRMMVLLATFTSLRFGELAALARGNVDVSTGFVTVVENQAQLSNGELFLKDPKSAAGRRAVPIPDDLLDELKQHLARVRRAGGGRSGVRRAEGRQAPPPELPQGVDQGTRYLRRTPGALPRSAPQREPVRRRRRCEPAGADGADGARQPACGDDLPARLESSFAAHRRQAQRPAAGGSSPGRRRLVRARGGHAG